MAELTGSEILAKALKKEGKPVSYMAPQEGAITWIDGWAICRS